MNLVLIGSGNVATVLGRLTASKGHKILEVVSRNTTNAHSLAAELGAGVPTDITAMTTEADMYIVAVSDDAIADVAKNMQLKNKMVAHTSGAVTKQVLQHASERFGVLYPLQSLRKESKHFPEIPLLIDGNAPASLQGIRSFAETLSQKVFHADDEERLKLHASAVFVSNFTNHLYALAAKYCANEGINFSLLVPLIREVAQRVEAHDPAGMQTGPAIRNDNATIQKHLQLLNGHPGLKKVYADMTESIQKFYQLQGGQ